ncbi:HutD family protein [Glutamicibacter sp.]|uniref:HutD family protein n=1 Tax=Glutamicibacter sp. TaxID=1931995 RepID=UPI0028BDBCC5|nr:HutD family protein [Glutamicibacter sp.]
MSNSTETFSAGAVIPLAQSSKQSWELGQVRVIAHGVLSEQGTIADSKLADSSWQLSVRSIEKAASFGSKYQTQVFTLIAGDFVQLEFDGQAQGLEPLRPLKISTREEIASSQPTEELLLLHVAADPAAARATVRIVELSKKRDQYLFDGQLGFLVQGSAKLVLPDSEKQLGLRDTVVGSDAGEPRINGRGFMAVVSFDLP